jgi:hypothetical protein
VKSLVACLLVAAAVAAPTGSAAPNENASCVAHGVHGPPGPPGQFQRVFHVPRFGEQVSHVARTEGGSFAECLANL